MGILFRVLLFSVEQKKKFQMSPNFFYLKNWSPSSLNRVGQNGHPFDRTFLLQKEK